MFSSQLGQVSLPSNSASDRVVGELPRERLNWLLGKTEGPSLLADHQWAEEHTQVQPSIRETQLVVGTQHH